MFFQEVLAAMPQLVGRPVTRRPRRRHPLRRRPVARRDGAPLPGARARRRRVRGRLGHPGARDDRGRGAVATASRSATARRPIPGHVGEYDLAYFQYALHQLTTRPRSWRPRGRRSDPAAGSSSSTGRCRPTRTNSGRGTARSSPASSSTSCTRARRSRRASSSWRGSRTAGLPAPVTHRPAVRARRRSLPSGLPELGVS